MKGPGGGDYEGAGSSQEIGFEEPETEGIVGMDFNRSIFK